MSIHKPSQYRSLTTNPVYKTVGETLNRAQAALMNVRPFAPATSHLTAFENVSKELRAAMDEIEKEIAAAKETQETYAREHEAFVTQMAEAFKARGGKVYGTVWNGGWHLFFESTVYPGLNGHYKENDSFEHFRVSYPGRSQPAYSFDDMLHFFDKMEAVPASEHAKGERSYYAPREQAVEM